MSDRKSNYIVILILFFLILPFYSNLIFSHPTFDDFFYSEKTRHFGYFEAQMKWYKYWTGKFFSTAILSLNPLFFRSIPGYDVFLFLVNALLPLMIYILLSQFSGRSFEIPQRVMSSLAIYFVYLFSMPSLSQGFYWLTGAVVYQLPLSLMLMFFILYLKLAKCEANKKAWMLTLACSLILLAITGSSEIAMVMVVSVFASFLIIKFLLIKKLRYYDVIFGLTIALGAFILISAPGNDLRSGYFSLRNNLSHSLLFSSKELSMNILSWLFTTPLIPLMLLLLPVFSKYRKGLGTVPLFVKLNPLIYLMLLLFVLFVCTFAPVWSTGLAPFKRTQNVVLFIFICGGIFLFIVSFFRYSFFEKLLSVNSNRLIFVSAAIILAMFTMTKNNARSSVADIITGTTYEYDRQMKERYKYIRQSTDDVIEVEAIRNFPRTFYFTDISTDKDFQYNIWYAQFFEKQHIRLKETLVNP